MSNRILIGDGWQQRILDKLGVDAAYLPFSVIEQPDNITVAEANIIEKIPDYANLTDDKRVYLESAVVCECAALLSVGMPSRLPSKQQGPHEGHTLYVDWDKKKLEFEAERDNYIGKIIDFSPSLSSFTVTYPRRW